ncbi:hypothetical protein ABZX92_23460 [Lentzea sp. NPDC006480]|uniref:hypothetical protein n=1 Tax=Lentzea sp. NPDC006480 TaxID=3157176 RepID=UPI0033AD83ED
MGLRSHRPWWQHDRGTRRDDQFTQDSILRGAHAGAWLLGLALPALPLVGVIRWPHPVRSAPISCVVLALAATHRLRRGEILLGLLTPLTLTA